MPINVTKSRNFQYALLYQALWEHEHLRSWFNYGDDPVGGPTASRIFASGAETDTTARTGASSANSSTIASS